ncbi:MAG TPA: molybdopterin-dependent oxidoreductase [Acidimicrobiia bacterium]|nr:molybdopterin-dependent oxidoreductase [Acidimicrobiia bacterium]
MNGLDYITVSPANAAVPLTDLDGQVLPQHRVYQRNSFTMPSPSEVTGEIEVQLPGGRRKTLGPPHLARLEQMTVEMVLECAGNGRSLITPAVAGLEWGLGGASPIRVGGVRLIDVLGEIPPEVIELVLTGCDRGMVRPEGEVPYQFSIPVDQVRRGHGLLVTELGDEPLGHEHGGPIRFVLPGHYAMKSVKWLTRIEGVTSPFRGHFVDRYRFFGDDEFDDGSPVARIQVRSVIAGPTEGERVEAGRVAVSGSAWSGSGPVTGVTVSVDDGEEWIEAEVEARPGHFAAAAWHLDLTLAPGEHVVMARATDASGSSQPLVSRWNRGGYANNVAHRVRFVAT